MAGLKHREAGRTSLIPSPPRLAHEPFAGFPRRWRGRRSRPWPAGRPRILVADSWLANSGDGAISLATDRRIRAVAPEAAVLHAAYQSDLVGHLYPDLAFVPPLADLVGVVPELPEARGWNRGRLDEVVPRADLVLSQGGGFLIEHYEPWQRLDAYERVHELGVPLGFLAQTIGPFRQPERRSSLARTLAGAAAIGVRDRRSLANVAELGVSPERIRLTADEAFSLFPSAPVAGEQRGVAVVLSQHTLTGDEAYVGDEPDLVGALAETVRGIAEAIDPEPVTILSTTQGLGPLERGLEDDDRCADEVVAELSPALRGRLERVRGYLPPLVCANLIARHRALVSMRMHPVIFALSKGVPAVPVTKAHKALDLLRDLGMEDLAPAWLDPQEIVAAVRTALDPGTPRGPELWDRLADARRRAELNAEVLAELIANARTRS